MTKAQILTNLEFWQARQQDTDRRIAELKAAAEVETECLAKMIGDTTGVLKWWQQQCQYGQNPLSAAKGKKMRLISNLKQLAGLIAE